MQLLSVTLHSIDRRLLRVTLVSAGQYVCQLPTRCSVACLLPPSPLSSRCWQRYDDHIVNIVSIVVVSHVVMELPRYCLRSAFAFCFHPSPASSSSALNLMTKVLRRAARYHGSSASSTNSCCSPPTPTFLNHLFSMCVCVCSSHFA